MTLTIILVAAPFIAWLFGVNPVGVIIIALAGGFILLARWASQSIPRAIVFVALLAATPFALGISLATLIAFFESAQHHVERAKR